MSYLHLLFHILESLYVKCELQFERKGVGYLCQVQSDQIGPGAYPVYRIGIFEGGGEVYLRKQPPSPEIKHWPPSSVEVKNAWKYISIPPYVLVI